MENNSLVGKHTVRAYDDSIAELKSMIVEMGMLASKEIRDALLALEERDDSKAENVRTRDHQLNRLEVEVESLATETIALRQPMAGDLRFLMACIKISSTIERIGDYAKNIAKRTLILNKYPEFSGQADVVHLGREVHAMFEKVIVAFEKNDLESAADARDNDQKIDKEYTKCFKNNLRKMFDDNALVGVGIHNLFIAKNLERVGDYICRIAEAHYFYINGEPVSNKRPKHDRSLEVLFELDNVHEANSEGIS